MAQPEFEWTNQDTRDAVHYVEEFARMSGAYFFPEEHQPEALRVSSSLARAALGFIGTKSDEGVALKFEDPLKSKYVKLADASIDIAGSLMRKVPIREVNKFYRSANARHEEERLSTGEKIVRIVLNNRGNPLSYLQIASLLFPEDTSPNVYSRTVNAMRNYRREVDALLFNEGLVLSETKVVRNNHGKLRMVLGFVAIPIVQQEQERIAREVDRAWAEHELQQNTQKKRADWAMQAWESAEARKEAPIRKWEWQLEARQIAAEVRAAEYLQKQAENQARHAERDKRTEARKLIPNFLEATKTVDVLFGPQVTSPSPEDWQPEEASTAQGEILLPAGLPDDLRTVVELMAQGLTTAEIAQKLHLSKETINYRLDKIYNLTGSASRTQIAYSAYEQLKQEGRIEEEFPPDMFKDLSAAEERVARLLPMDLTNEEIASNLYIGVETVKHHIRHIYQKSDARNRLHLSLAAAIILGNKPQLAQVTTPRRSAEPKKSKSAKKVQSPQLKALPKIDTQLKPESFIPTLGIQVARQVVRIIPPNHLEEYRKFKFSLNNPGLLERLRQIEVITDEEVETAEIGVRGVAVALALKTERGQQLLSDAEHEKEYVDMILANVSGAIEKEIERRKKSR